MIRICKIIQDDIWIEHNHKIIKTSIKGVFRNQAIKPIVGDYVELQWSVQQPIIEKILLRKNTLSRPNVANVDLVILVQSTIEPDFNTLLLDKMLVAYAIAGVKVVIALTKTDLGYSEEIKQLVSDYKYMHYSIFDVNSDIELQQMINKFDDQVICFVGNSGVGKSTLINKIIPDINIHTQEISKALNRGKHTTTNTSIISYKNYYVVDTPGYSSIVIDISQHLLAHNFFGLTIGDGYCRYNDCFHLPANIGCIVKQNVENGKISTWRYENYLEINKTLEHKYDKPKLK